MRELFGAAGPRLGVLGSMAKLPGFNVIFGLMYDFMSKNRSVLSCASALRHSCMQSSSAAPCHRFAISKGATKVSKTIGKE